MASAAPVTSQLPTSDRLSTLPVEILTEIFQLAYTDTSPSEGPICHALLPFDHIQRFRRVKVDSPSRLNWLAVLLENGSMGAWIKEMEMNKVDGENGALPLQHRQLRTFFAALPHLTHLMLDEGCPALLKHVLSQTLARNSLRKMESITFVAPLEWKNPFEPTQFFLLATYPSLHTLRIKSTKGFHEMRRVRPIVKKFQPFPLIQTLSLEGGDGVELPKLIKRAIDACPSLVHLDLTDQSSDPDYTALLPHLPEQLVTLSLRTHAFYDAYSAPCDALFLRFSNLEYLYLGEGTFSPAILTHLSFLPKLKTLGFGLGAILHTADLSILLDESTPLPALRTLILDSVKGKIGWRVLEDGYGDLHSEATAPDYLGPGWLYPSFSDEGGPFTEENVEELLKKAAAPESRIKIEGTAEAALEVTTEFWSECADCDLAKLMETGDFTEIRAMMGDEWVEMRLEDFGWYEDGFCEGCGEWHDY
ncbi:hypothetical protein JCM10207_000194 [Rhodosporidiobolus poonsookiae]